MVENGKVYIGCDSAEVCGDEIEIRKDPKVFKNGDFLIGYTSSFRMGQILRYRFVPPPLTSQDLFGYMCCDFVPAVIDALKENGYAKVENNEIIGGFFLVGIRGRLFQVESDFQISESTRDFMAIGSGAPYALGVMHCSELRPEIRIEKALGAAVEFSTCVRKPFLICKTTN